MQLSQSQHCLLLPPSLLSPVFHKLSSSAESKAPLLLPISSSHSAENQLSTSSGPHSMLHMPWAREFPGRLVQNKRPITITPPCMKLIYQSIRTQENTIRCSEALCQSQSQRFNQHTKQTKLEDSISLTQGESVERVRTWKSRDSKLKVNEYQMERLTQESRSLALPWYHWSLTPRLCRQIA